ncbi:NAD(P)/FAD-dependent oxidoreductase [Sphingomonas quercus]|uniref:NAD(P)/FAD-dependent oxidoreductase n=1 Tax=Sphingomonas quercus TaxID=2842451 RepID=UPI00209B3AFB|nr:FAD-binding oxidoreductase [Sphingomonas quercus]
MAAAYPSSWYAATAGPPPAAAPLAGAQTADVCVVGGGYAGLSTALHLARAGMAVVLLEQAQLGWGASGRNGGQVHVGMRRDQEWLERRLGPETAMALWRIALDARDHLDWLITGQGADCDFVPGHLHVDHKPRIVADTRRHVALMNERYDHRSLRFVDREEVRARVASHDYHGGMLDMRGGHLHALKLAFGIARAALGAGARLHPASPATGFARQDGRWRVETPAGHVLADRVVIAGNGYLRGLVPAVEARVMPIANYIAVTEPFGEAGARALIRDGEAVSDSRFVVYYFRTTADHRLLFGGGESYSYRAPNDIAGLVREHMLRIFPQLAKARIDYGWQGMLAITPNRLPLVREVAPGITNISGFSGLGVVLAPYFGKLVADALANADGAALDRLAALPVPRFPGGRWLRWPTLVAAMSFFALRDRL